MSHVMKSVLGKPGYESDTVNFHVVTSKQLNWSSLFSELKTIGSHVGTITQVDDVY